MRERQSLIILYLNLIKICLLKGNKRNMFPMSIRAMCNLCIMMNLCFIWNSRDFLARNFRTEHISRKFNYLKWLHTFSKICKYSNANVWFQTDIHGNALRFDWMFRVNSFESSNKLLIKLFCKTIKLCWKVQSELHWIFQHLHKCRCFPQSLCRGTPTFFTSTN